MLNQTGSSLVSVLVAAGLAAVVTAGTSSMILNSRSSFESNKSSVGKLNLQQDLQSIFSDSAVCGSKLKINDIGRLTSGSLQLNVLINEKKIGIDSSAARSLYNLDNVKLNFKNVRQIGTEPSTGFKIYEGEVYLNSEKKMAVVGGKSLHEIFVGPLAITLNNSQQVVSCASHVLTAMNPMDLCTQVGGAYNNTTGSCIVAPQCPSGQLMVSNGPGKPGTCQAPPVQIITQTVYVSNPTETASTAPSHPSSPPSTPSSPPSTPPSTPPSSPSGPKPGDQTGYAYCGEYLKSHPTCANAGCGGGNSGCASTWKFFGTAQSGGCATGNRLVNSSVGSALVGYTCVLK